jgi:hypothetical protein
MCKTIKDLTKVSVRDAENNGLKEYHLEGRFKNGEKYTIAIFDESCEAICDEVKIYLNEKIL